MFDAAGLSHPFDGLRDSPRWMDAPRSMDASAVLAIRVDCLRLPTGAWLLSPAPEAATTPSGPQCATDPTARDPGRRPGVHHPPAASQRGSEFRGAVADLSGCVVDRASRPPGHGQDARQALHAVGEQGSRVNHISGMSLWGAGCDESRKSDSEGGSEKPTGRDPHGTPTRPLHVCPDVVGHRLRRVRHRRLQSQARRLEGGAHHDCDARA
jgi:hypothetical protein